MVEKVTCFVVFCMNHAILLQCIDIANEIYYIAGCIARRN